jgi:hypothetical protein
MSGGHSELEPPLPISNRAVKRFCANDSMLRACESRSPPDSLYKTLVSNDWGFSFQVLILHQIVIIACHYNAMNKPWSHHAL